MQSWFRDKQKKAQAKSKSSSKDLKLFIDLCGESISSNEPEMSDKPIGTMNGVVLRSRDLELFSVEWSFNMILTFRFIVS